MFKPKTWRRDDGNRIVFVIRELRKYAEVLVINSVGLLQVKRVLMFELEHMEDIDFGKRQARKMKASLRRIARRKGTTKKARAALREILK